ncbi:RNA polymerase II transcription factor B subunit 1 [Apiospora hydei]|uniref:RNA polymerase II transcription factor B subunit 1 n=1 Tax=Apiospora hydei TaxID=1337664 RepID=A0ABR1XAC5_9PEZI
MATTAAAPPVLADIANTAAAPRPLKPRKLDSDEDSSSEILSSMPDAFPTSSSTICATEDTLARTAPEPATAAATATTKQFLRPATPARLMNIDLNYESPLARLELTPFLYGRGTELAPITEQRSLSTLRNGINVKDRSISAQEQEFPLLSRSGGLRRQESFSLDSGKSHILQTQQQYQHEQALLHRSSKEPTSATHGGSSSFSSSAAARRQSIDTARILAEIKSYPHLPPFSPHTQVVTPPEYHEWALSHPGPSPTAGTSSNAAASGPRTEATARIWRSTLLCGGPGSLHHLLLRPRLLTPL